MGKRTVCLLYSMCTFSVQYTLCLQHITMFSYVIFIKNLLFFLCFCTVILSDLCRSKGP